MVYFFYETLGGKDGVSQISYTWAHDVRKKTDIITAEIICHENYVPCHLPSGGAKEPLSEVNTVHGRMTRVMRKYKAR